MTNPIQQMIDQIKAAEPRPIPDELSDVDRMIGAAYEHAKQVLVGAPSDTQLQPAWLILTASGQTALILTPFGDEGSKEATATMMAHLMREVGAIRYTLATEAWMASQTPEERAVDKRPPSERDDRIEAVMIMGSDRAGSVMDAYEIVRDWETGQVLDLKPLDKGEGKRENVRVSGRFADLLEEAS